METIASTDSGRAYQDGVAPGIQKRSGVGLRSVLWVVFTVYLAFMSMVLSLYVTLRAIDLGLTAPEPTSMLMGTLVTITIVVGVCTPAVPLVAGFVTLLFKRTLYRVLCLGVVVGFPVLMLSLIRMLGS